MNTNAHFLGASSQPQQSLAFHAASAFGHPGAQQPQLSPASMPMRSGSTASTIDPWDPQQQLQQHQQQQQQQQQQQLQQQQQQLAAAAAQLHIRSETPGNRPKTPAGAVSPGGSEANFLNKHFQQQAAQAAQAAAAAAGVNPHGVMNGGGGGAGPGNTGGVGHQLQRPPTSQSQHQQQQIPPHQQQQPSQQSTPQPQQQLLHFGSGPASIENEKTYYLILDLLSPKTREAALLELSKKREVWEDLALVLWHSFGVMSALLQEIMSVYPLLYPPSLTAQASNRVCNALALLQCVASHPETRGLFLSAHIPLFLYPFLNTTSKTRPFEYLRLTSLGVIGALVKQNDNSDVINFLLSTEIIPLCLRIMETGSELSKTVAIFIVQKILLDETGLGYICQTYERFFAVATVLANMVNQLVETQAVRLLKHVVRCYLRLSDNLRAREALRACLPDPLRDATFSQALKGDAVTKRCLASLLYNLSDRIEP